MQDRERDIPKGRDRITEILQQLSIYILQNPDTVFPPQVDDCNYLSN